jgi:hypothetical protein
MNDKSKNACCLTNLLYRRPGEVKISQISHLKLEHNTMNTSFKDYLFIPRSAEPALGFHSLPGQLIYPPFL